MVLDVIVPGPPVPQGSKRHVGNGRMIESNAEKLRPWRELAVSLIEQQVPSGWNAGLPMTVTAVFCLPRTKNHFGTGRNSGVLKESAPQHVTKKPDVDKLLRAVLDVCTIAGVWRDDSQATSVTGTKRYTTEKVGTFIRIESIQNQ